jgi:hypothetical protein
MYETELVFGGLIGAWILYEVYGRTALEWLTQYTTYIRIAGGVAVLGYLYWQARASPEGFTNSLEAAKTLLTSTALAGSGAATGGTREKRNVTGLMKKKVAAGQSWKCGHCSATLDETYEVDHKLALFNGGSNDMSNLIALCPGCHRKKTVDERIAAA